MPTDEEYLSDAGLEETTTPDETTANAADAGSPEKPGPGETFAFHSDGKDYSYPTNAEFHITHGGVVQKVPFSTLANTYRQATHLNDKFSEFNTRAKEFESQQEEYQKYKDFYSKYGPLQDWSEKNPQDWEIIQDLWKNRDQHLLQHKTGARPASGVENSPNFEPLIQELTQLKSQNQDLLNWKKEFETQQEQQQMESDKQFVLDEKKKFQEENPEIDLEEADADGVKLWAKIMQFGVNEGLPTFESAALLFLKPRLQETWAHRQRNNEVKQVQKEKQEGIVAKSSTPFQRDGQSASPVNMKEMSYEDLKDKAVREYEELVAQTK